jgi:hypothetical protein
MKFFVRQSEKILFDVYQKPGQKFAQCLILNTSHGVTECTEINEHIFRVSVGK